MKITEHNVTSGEIIEREMTDEEIAQKEIDAANDAAIKIESENKISARQAVLDKLGLSADEVAALLG